MKNKNFLKKLTAGILGFVMTLGVGAAGYSASASETKAADTTLTIDGSSKKGPWSTSYGNGTKSTTSTNGAVVELVYTQTATMSSTIQIKANTSNGFYSTTCPADFIKSVTMTVKTNTATLSLSVDGSNWVSKGTSNSFSLSNLDDDGYKFF